MVNYRPEYQHGWGGKSYYTQLRIDPLPPESCEDLLEGLLGTDAELAAPEAEADQADAGQPVLPRGKHPDAGRNPGPRRRARSLSADQAARGHPGSGHRAGHPGGADRPPAAGGKASAAGGRGDRRGRALRAAARRSRTEPEDTLQHGLAHLQAAEFLYETRPVSRTSSTPSGTASRTRWRTAACCTSAAGAARADRRGDRSALFGPADRAGRTSRPPRVPRRDYGRRRCTISAQAGARALDRSAHREAEPYFEQALIGAGASARDA